MVLQQLTLLTKLCLTFGTREKMLIYATFSLKAMFERKRQDLRAFHNQRGFECIVFVVGWYLYPKNEIKQRLQDHLTLIVDLILQVEK